MTSNFQLALSNAKKVKNDEFYTRYEDDNYQAVNVDKLVDIPDHYYGVIGVPVTFLTKYRKTQSLFNVLGVSSSSEVGGKKKYARVFIQRKAVK